MARHHYLHHFGPYFLFVSLSMGAFYGFDPLGSHHGEPLSDAVTRGVFGGLFVGFWMTLIFGLWHIQGVRRVLDHWSDPRPVGEVLGTRQNVEVTFTCAHEAALATCEQLVGRHFEGSWVKRADKNRWIIKTKGSCFTGAGRRIELSVEREDDGSSLAKVDARYRWPFGGFDGGANLGEVKELAHMIKSEESASDLASP